MPFRRTTCSMYDAVMPKDLDAEIAQLEKELEQIHKEIAVLDKEIARCNRVLGVKPRAKKKLAQAPTKL